MAQVYANGTPVPYNSSIIEVVALAGANGAPITSSAGRLPTEPLGQPTVARQLIASASSNNVALTPTCRRISIYARNANIRYLVGNTAQTANSTSHYIAAMERLNLNVPSNPNIAVIRADSSDGILEITELV
jgi:hypothetical protein